jgi:hypothetical protein
VHLVANGGYFASMDSTKLNIPGSLPLARK